MTSRTWPSPRSLVLSPHWLWLLPLAAAFAPTAAWLIDRWTVDIYYNGHGLFVPFVVAYLVREHLQRDPITQPEGSAWGFLFMAAGLGMLAADVSIQTDLLGAAGLVVCLPGLSLLLLGGRRTRALAFPLLLCLFMLPVPAGAISHVHLVLRQISAVGAHLLVSGYGIPVLKEGTTLYLPHATVEVADACSGVSTLQASVLLGMVLSYLSDSVRRRIALMVAAVLLAVLCNSIRVAGLVLMVHYWGVDLLATPLHQLSGVAVFVVVLIVLFAISGRNAPPSPAPA